MSDTNKTNKVNERENSMKRTRSANKNFTMDLKADASQSTTWDFEVHQEELKTSRGISSGIHAVVRNDTGAVIGKYMGQKMIAYREIVEAFETGLSNSGFSFTRELIVTGDGARFFGTYKIGAVMIGGEQFENELRLQSSHNGSLRWGFNYRALRLACLNAAEIMSIVYAIMRKHSSNFDASVICENVHKAIDAGQNQLARFVERMANMPLTDEQARTILSNIVGMGSKVGVSPRAGYVIYDNWKKPSSDELPLGNTLYRLFNAATRFCRDLENKKRFEMSLRANRYITGAMQLGIEKDYNMAQLLAVPANALDFDGVTVEQ